MRALIHLNVPAPLRQRTAGACAAACGILRRINFVNTGIRIILIRV